jgi:GNAT superfamily N-acetyltransferase
MARPTAAILVDLAGQSPKLQQQQATLEKTARAPVARPEPEMASHIVTELATRQAVRPVADGDWSRIGELGELLVRAHHAFEPSRFIHPDDLRADIYTARVREEIRRGRATVFVAEAGGQIAGYVFVGVEPESWKELRSEAGFIHDVAVDASHRHQGVGGALIATAVDWLGARGVTRVMLWTAQGNADAQRLFGRLGFRPTMIEMSLVLP